MKTAVASGGFRFSSSLGYRVIVISATLVLVLLVATAIALGPYRLAAGDLLAFLIAKTTGATSPLPAPA